MDKHYLKKGERVMPVFENEKEISYREGREKGLLKGHEKGLLKGRKEGRMEGHEKGLLKGRMEGHEKGRQDERQKLALRLLKKKMDLAFISEVTGLSQKEITKLRNGS